MSVTLTTSAQTASGTTLTFASTAGVTAGMAVSGTNIPVGDTVASVTGTTVVLSQAVTGAVASGATVSFNTVTQINITTSSDTPSGTVLPFFDTTGVTAGMYAYGTSIANSTTVASVTPTTVTLSAALTGDVPINSSITFSSNANFTPTPTPAPSVTPLTTSAATQSGATLPFASTTGVTVGMYSYARNIPSGATVASMTSTSVTLSRQISGPIGNAATVLFSTINTGIGATTPTPTPVTESTLLRNITNFLRTVTSTNGKTYIIPGNAKGVISGAPSTALPPGIVYAHLPLRAAAPVMGAASPRARANPAPSEATVQARLPAHDQQQRAPEAPPAPELRQDEPAPFHNQFDGAPMEPPPEPQNAP